MVQICSDRVELIARTIDAVDGVIRDAFEVMNISVARLLRDVCVLYRRHPRYRTNKEDVYRCLRVHY